MNIWDDILNYPILDTRSFGVSDSTLNVINSNPELSETFVQSHKGFILAPINFVLFLVIFLIGKLCIKYLKRYFKILQLEGKQFKIEGREIALWKLIKQVIYFLVIYSCFQSLNINNSNIDFGNVLAFEFFRVKSFYVAVYHIFLVILVVFIAKLLVNFLKLYFHKNISKRVQLDKGTEFVVIQLAKYVIYTIAIIILLRSFGLSIDLLLTGSAALLVGVGLGMQDIFKDFLSGLLLLFEGSNKVGDIIEIHNYNGEDNFIAQIKEINLRTSKVETRDSKTLIIPNSILTHQSVNNWSFSTSVIRFQIPITIHYGTDVELAKQLLTECAQSHPRVKNTQPVFVRLRNFGNNGLELDVVFWAEQNFYIDIYKSEIRFAIEKAFRENGIGFPYSQTDIHIKKDL
ncbi:hypothetical protein DNU06_09570 [Putridiphycobacter roseus]|uniref:Mechanosensitive ion channel family protein n=1 Tax=Putridiphycobacter roseus TaxID=2219161 RepID=A0A2W1MXV5_9FLAO|nr:mechanosensitive ion channel domain-containing protein [Putridiphycobacter roseus]PZE16989.1 hypothetical protein DNU06_09570 [Putridiphycobacter roseus]